MIEHNFPSKRILIYEFPFHSPHFTVPKCCADLAWASLEQRAGQPLEKGQLPLTEVGWVGKMFAFKWQEFVQPNENEWFLKRYCQNIWCKFYEKRGSSDLKGISFMAAVDSVWKVLHVRNTGMQLELSVKAGWNSPRTMFAYQLMSHEGRLLEPSSF